MSSADPISRLMAELAKLPGIGPKSAQRIAFHLMFQPKEEVRRLAEAIWKARDQVRPCSVCGDLADRDPCSRCTDPTRDPSVICVVEHPRDVHALERVREYRGRYHVLQGVISPMEGVGPGDLTIKALLSRLEDGQVREVILATNPTVEGEATALYLARLLKPMGIHVTRIARGLPEGGDLDYVDEITLSRALEGRREIS